jgi:ribonuclease D
MNYNPTIHKEAVSILPTAAFRGTILLVTTPEELDSALEYLCRQPVLGFDTETRPSFSRGKKHKVALLQLSTADRCFLIRLNELGMPPQLVELLNNELVMKIGLSLRDDFNALGQRVQVKPDSFIDLQHFVENYGIEDKSLQKIYAIIFGQRISKSQRLTNWEAVELTEAQQIYAATDAWACYQIYQHLINNERLS